MLRFAISVTKDMDINDMRIALLTYISSRQSNEKFAVKMEDIGKADDGQGKDQETLDLLKKFAMEQDQLFYQHESLGRYQQFALSLVGQKKAFVCICDKTDSCSCKADQIEIAKEIKDKALKYKVYLDDFIVLDKDGLPSYDFATACDDMLLDISTAFVNKEKPDSSSRQTYIQKSLGYTPDQNYSLMPAILSQEPITIKSLLKQGFLPDAIIDYILSLGYMSSDKKIHNLPDAIKHFKIDQISQENVTFDMEEMKATNREHLTKYSDKDLSKIFGFADDDIGKLLKLYIDHGLSSINELDSTIKAIFASKKCEKDMKMVADIISKSPLISDFEEFQKYIIDKSKLEQKELSSMLRLLVTGATSGPELSKIYPLVKTYITAIARCD